MYTLHIGNKNYSSWSLRPWLLMTQLSIPFKEQMNPFDEGSSWDKFREFSPNGLVPCLIDKSDKTQQRIVWDSLAIAEYLAEEHSSVWPADKEARAWARCATAEMHSGFSALRNQCPMICALRIKPNEVSQALQGDLDRIDELWNEGLNRFSGPFLAGADFSVVDAFYAPVIFRLRTYNFKMSDNVSSYLELMLSLDSMIKWNDEAIAEKWRETSHEQEVQESGIIIEDFR